MAEMIIDVGVNTDEAKKKLADLQKTATDKDIEYDIDVNTEKAKKELKSFEKETQTIGSKLKSTFSSALDGVGFGAGLFAVQNVLGGIANAATEAFNSYKEFDSQVQNIATLGVVDDLNGLKNVLNEVSKTTVDDASVLAGATYQALSAGVKGSNEELGSFIQTASKVATAGGSDAETAVDALTTVMNAFKLSTEDADMVSDQFFGTIKAGKTSFPELAGSLSNVASIASTAGVKFGEVGGAVAQLTALGTPTSVATNQLKSLLTELIAPADGTAKTFKSLGFDVKELAQRLKEPVDEGGGLVNVMADIEKSSSKAGLTLFDVFSSSEAAAAGLALSGDNAASALNNVNSVLFDSAGSASFAYDEASTSIQNQIGLIKGSIQALFNDIFMSLEPFIKGFLTAFGTTFDFLVSTIKTVKEAIGDFFNSIANSPFGELVANVFNQIKTSISNLIPSIEDIKNGFNVFKQTLSDLAPIIVLGASAFAGYQLSVNSAAIGTKIFNVAARAAYIAQNLVNTAMTIGSTVVTAVTSAYQFFTSGQVIATAKTYLFAAAQRVLNLVMSLNPIGIVVTALGALAAGLIYAYNASEDFRNILNNLYEKAIKPLIDALADGATSVLKFFGLLSDEPDNTGIEKTTKEIEKLNEETEKSNEVLTDNVEVVEDNKQAFNDLGGAVKEVTLNDLINDLVKLKIAGKENTPEFTKLQDRIIKLNSEEQKFSETLKQVKNDLGITKEANEFGKSLEKISSDFNKLSADLQDKELINSFSNDLNGEIASLQDQIQPIDLSNIIVTNEGLGSNVLNDLFGVDLGLISTDVDLIKQKANELIELSNEISQKRLDIIANERDKQIALRTQQFEREKKARQDAFNEEIAEKGFQGAELDRLQTEFDNNEKVRLQLFNLEKEQIIKDANVKEQEETKKNNDELNKIQQDALDKEKQLNQQKLDALNQYTEFAAQTFSGLVTDFEGTSKDLLKMVAKTALDALDALIPVWTAQIIAGSLATPQSIATGGVAGIAQFTLLTGLLKGAVSVAKASIGGLESGGFASEHKPAGASDTILRWLNPNEYVLNERATRSISKEDLNYMNTYGRVPNDNKDLVKELRNAKLVNTEIKLNVKDYTGGKFKIERVYR